jgi:hypothetical protein
MQPGTMYGGQSGEWQIFNLQTLKTLWHCIERDKRRRSAWGEI